MALPFSAVSPSVPTTITLTIATPCVITWAGHNLWPNDALIINTTGALPTGLSTLTVYYVIAAGFAPGSFQIAASAGGAAINTSGTQSGTHSAVAVLNTLPNAGQAVMANSLGVAIASDQSAVPITGNAGTAGGTSVYSATGGTGNALLLATVTAVKASAGNLYGDMLDNSAGSQKVYVQFFDLATGSVTLGTTVPKFVLAVPNGGFRDDQFGDEGKITFATAISVAATTTPTGLTAPTTGLVANFYYK